MSTSTARSAMSPRVSPAADAIHERTYSTSRVQHVHLETHGSIAWRGEDGRIHVRTSSQAPFIAKQKLCHLFRPQGPRRPCLHRARRRRVRRQAGNALRRPVRARRAQDRPSGEVGIHPRGAVHRRLDPPPDDDPGQARRQAGRHPDSDRDPCRLQHRRLWRARRRDAWPRRSAARLSLYRCDNKKADGFRGLYQHGAGRRLPRLWRLADDLRHRMRDRRSGAPARHRSVRYAAKEHGAGDRLDRIGVARPLRCRLSAATGSTNASTGSRGR